MMVPRVCVPFALVAFVAACEREPVPSPQAPTARTDAEEATRPQSDADPPAKPGAMAPRLVADGNGVLLSWLQPGDGDAQTVGFSRYDGRWSLAVTVTSSDQLFANWADVPAVTRAKSGWYLASWLQKSGEGKYDYGIQLAGSEDGRTWKPMGLLHDDGTPTEHGFVSMVPWREGVEVFWLDGRQMAAKPPGPMTLRRAHVTSEGVGESSTVDAKVCDCCGTGAAVTSDGPLVVYRNRDGDEVRDIGIVRLSEDNWTEPRLVHGDAWTVPGCPVNGPQVIANRERVVAAWFTGARQHPSVRAAFSKDGGMTFDAPINVATYGPGGAVPLGRVDIVDVDDDVVVSWLDSRDSETVVAARRVSADGRLSPVYDVARSDDARSSGFPQLERVGDDLLFVWTSVGEPSHLRGRLVPIELLGNVGRDAPKNAAASGPSKNWRVPILQAKTLDGESVRLRSNDKPLLVSIWATWCEPCRKELPVLAELQKTRGDTVDIVAINVDVASEREVVERWSQLAPGLQIWLDSSLRAQTVFGATSLPANFLFDERGRLVWHSSAVLDPNDPALSQALADE